MIEPGLMMYPIRDNLYCEDGGSRLSVTWLQSTRRTRMVAVVFLAQFMVMYSGALVCTSCI